MDIAFTGHRNRSTDSAALTALAAEFPGATWIHGGAEGFDAQVSAFAQAHGIPQMVIRPDYRAYHPKKAPLIRNEQIVARGSLLVACWDGRDTGGTAYTVRYARKQGKEVRVLTPR